VQTDIFSLGVVFYEMLTGVHPFRKKTALETIVAILKEDAPPMNRWSVEAPELFERLEGKMLTKDRGKRYRSLTEVHSDLGRLREDSGRRLPDTSRKSLLRFWPAAILVLAVALLGIYWSGFSPSESGDAVDLHNTRVVEVRKSIAVLPLENLTGDPGQDYFVDGMTEALTTELSRLRALKVIARTSVMRYKETDKSAREIAGELGVDVLVEGSVLRAGNEVRITTQLIDGSTEEHLWVQSFDRELNNILALHSDVARAVAREIQIVVTPEETAHLAATHSVEPEAYELYLNGRYHYNKWTTEGFRKAADYFQQAITHDSDYAPAYAGLVGCYQWFAWFGVMPAKDAYARFEAPLKRALEIGDSLAEVNLVRADTSFYFEWDWERAEKEYRRAIELNPSFARAHSYFAWYLAAMDRFSEALAAARTGLQLDPFSTAAKLTLGEIYFNARQYEQAITEYRQSIQLDPNDPAPYNWLATVYEHQGMYELAVRARRRALTLSGDRPQDAAELGNSYRESGTEGYLMWRLGRLEDQYAPYTIAEIHAQLGDQAQAFAWLEKAYQQRHTQMVMLKVSPSWDSLSGDPRF